MEDWKEKLGIQEVDVKTEGITEDYVWWNARILTGKMTEWTNDFQRMVNVMEARHKEHLKMISDLLEERKRLKALPIQEQEAIVLHNELYETESFLHNLIEVENGKFFFERLTPDEVEGQISNAMKRLSQLLVRLEAKE